MAHRPIWMKPGGRRRPRVVVMLQDAYRLAMAPVSAAVGVGRWARDVSLDVAGDAALSGLDALLASRRADEAADRILTSPLVEHVVTRALDRAVADRVPQRITDRLLEDGLAEQLAQRFLDGPELERMVVLVLESERVDAALVSALESADTERLITRIVESRLIEETVTGAITQRGLGLADEVAGQVCDRSRAADARLERAARRVLRRRTPGAGTPEPLVP